MPRGPSRALAIRAGLFDLRGLQDRTTLCSRPCRVIQQQCRQIIIFSEEEGGGNAQGLGQLLHGSITGFVGALLILIDARAGHGFVEAGQDAQPTLRESRAFTGFAEASGDRTAKSISGSHGSI